MSDTALIALGVNFVLWVLTLILTAHYSCLGNISRRQGVTQVNSQALPSVAVVIVAQEEAGELRRHLPVFLQQKYPAEYQVIVVDIHSTDDTQKLLEELEEDYPQLTHSCIPPSARDISKQRLAMMLGTKTACTEWVVFTKADCCPGSNEWLASFMLAAEQGKEAVIGLTRYAQCEDIQMRKRQFLRLWKQMLWIPFAEHHHPYWAEDSLLAYRREYFFSHQGFRSDSKRLAGAAALLVNRNISKGQCAVSVSPKAVMIQDNPLPHTWLQERVFDADIARHAAYKYLYGCWYDIKMLIPLIYMTSTVVTCILCLENYILTGVTAALWLCVWIVRDIVFNRTARQLNIKTFHLLLPFLCAAVPVWESQAWIKWCLTSKKVFRKKFV